MVRKYIYIPHQNLYHSHRSKTMITMNYTLEELVEGTMINLFWNDYLDEWDIATKNSLGGKYSFYQDNKKTFRTMFLRSYE